MWPRNQCKIPYNFKAELLKYFQVLNIDLTFPGIENGGELCVRGENIMLGYIFNENPGKIVPLPNGWYDTGDAIEIDNEGYIKIVTVLSGLLRYQVRWYQYLQLRMKLRFVGQITAMVLLAFKTPSGEKLVLVTEKPDADRLELTKLKIGAKPNCDSIQN